MINKKIQVSIIVVNYEVEEELIACIFSIVNSKPKTSIEIIVVDNDGKSKLKSKLKNFDQVKYIRSQRNLGYSGGNNLGAKYASGEYLFFLNPDTLVIDNVIEQLYKFIKPSKSIGIASPLLVDNQLIPFKTQSRKELTPLNAIYSFSFLRKFFPKKNIYNDDFFKYWDKKISLEVDTVPGAALIISKKLFDKIDGFDENFFLYFEENDLSKRIKSLGYKQFIYPKSKIIHTIGQSTKQMENKESIFAKSRFYYLKKHYGLIPAFFTELLIRTNKKYAFLFLAIILGAFLRVYRIGELMPFIGDQGWFYLSARDMVINGEISLVGIASSHPWLHQGPLWTYMLAGTFWLFGFNPLNGAYLTIALGVFSILLIYIVGSEMFSQRVGLIASILYATSPLVILHSRTPYHTSPIPLFTLLFIFSLYKWIKGNGIFFPFSIFFLAILYNLELATAMLWPVLIIVLGYGLWKKKEWVKKTFNEKNLIYSFLAFLFPMIPIIIYDFNNNFPQTIKFAVWIGYRILKFFGFPSVHGRAESVNFDSMINFFFNFYQYLVFPGSKTVAFIILVLSFGMLIYFVYNLLTRRKSSVGGSLLVLWTLIPLFGYFVNKTSSEAYLPIFFPVFICLIALFLERFFLKKIFSVPIILITLLVISNIYFLIFSNYFTNKLSFSTRLASANEIIKKSGGRDYNILGKGNGSQFESFTMNYEYLTWWLGHPSSKKNEKIKIYITEQEDEIFVQRKNFYE